MPSGGRLMIETSNIELSDIARTEDVDVAMADGFIRQSEGHICVDTVPGYGTTFCIYLPRVDAAAASATPQQAAPAAMARGSETILIAEDEPAVRSLVRKTLETQGY